MGISLRNLQTKMEKKQTNEKNKLHTSKFTLKSWPLVCLLLSDLEVVVILGI
jgi:hypothetical protein